MNIITRLIRLPLVISKGPAGIITNATGFIITHLFLKTTLPNTPNLLASPTGVESLSPLGLINMFIQHIRTEFGSHADDDVYRYMLTLSFRTVRFIVKSLTEEKTTAITTGKMPHIVAGKIDSKHIVSNMHGKTFIIALSNPVIEYIGFTLVTIKLIICFFIAKKIMLHIYTKYIRDNQKSNQDAIDVKHRKATNEEDKTKPIFLQKYLNQ